MQSFPKQRLSSKEKLQEDSKWARDIIDFVCVQNADTPFYDRPEFDRKLANYQLFNNQLNQSDFERECNPYGIEVGQFKDSIQPYNKTYNKIQVLLGEEFRRPFNYKAVLINSEGVKSKLAERDMMIRDYVMNSIQKVIQSVSPNFSPELVEKESSQIMDPTQISKWMNTSYLESREILASKILEYLTKKQSLREKKNDGFKHGLLAGEEFLYVGIENNEPIIKVLNPLGVFYHKSSDTKYIQDGLYAGYKCYLTSGEILDRYGLYLTKEQQSKIDGTNSFGLSNAHEPTPDMKYYNDEWSQYYQHTSLEGAYSPTSYKDWLVQTVEWKSEKKVGFLTFINEYGEQEEIIVDENFSIPTNATKETIIKEFGRKCDYYIWSDSTNSYRLEWGWIPEVWTGTRIGNDIYTMIGPKQLQFRSIDNPYDVKLGYHGLVYSSMNSSPVSLMDRMKPFQYLYFIIMHKLKKLIAQDKGRIFHFDLSMVDPSMGWEKTMYYLTEMNIDFYNPLQNADQPGWSQRGKISSSTDMSQAQNIINYINLLSSLDQQISDVAGVNRQREGQTSPTEAVTNAQSNIQMSAVITEIYFQAHNKLWEQALTSLIQTAQAVYKDKSILRQYVLDDMSISTLEITPESLNNSDFSIFLSDSAKEDELFSNMKSLVQALVQSGTATMSDAVRMFKENSIESLEQEINEVERSRQEQAQQQSQAQLEHEAQLQKDAQAFQLEFQRRELENKILLAEIDSFKFQQDQDKDRDGTPDQLEIAKFQAELALKTRKLDLEEKKIKQDAIHHKE